MRLIDPLSFKLRSVRFSGILMADTQLHHFQQFCLRESQFFNHIPHWYHWSAIPTPADYRTSWNPTFTAISASLMPWWERRRRWNTWKKPLPWCQRTPQRDICAWAAVSCWNSTKLSMVWYGMGHLFLNCDFGNYTVYAFFQQTPTISDDQ